MKAVLVSAPSITLKKTDAATGFLLADQPVQLAAPAPAYADGTPFTVKDAKSGTWLLDPAAAKATYSFGALLYRLNADGTVQVFDGTAWQSDAGFDAFAPAAKPAEFAFDPKANTWSATFVMATAVTAPKSLTDAASGRPRYGFVSVFLTPKTAPTMSLRSARGAPFPITSSSASRRVAPGPVKGLDPSQDPKGADGFAVFVKDGAGFIAAELLLSSDTGQTETIVLRYAQAGIERASVAISNDGTLRLHSVTAVHIDAPVLQLNGELQAGTIRYVSAGDGTEHTL